MVTSTKGPTLSAGAGGRRGTRGAASRASIWDRIRALVQRGVAGIPSIAGTPRLRRELLGFGLVLIALLTAWVLGRGGDEGGSLTGGDARSGRARGTRRPWCQS